MPNITIDSVIDKLNTEVIRLEALNHINVTTRIDYIVDYLKDILHDEYVIKGDQKFDLTSTVSENCTVVYKKNGSVISAGSNVLTYGDDLTVEITSSTGYTIETFTINGTNYADGTDNPSATLEVVDNIAVVVGAVQKTFDLSTIVGSNCTLAVTRGGVAVEDGVDVLTYGDVLTITGSTSEAGHNAVIEVNGESFTSGATLTVEENVAIDITSVANTYDLTATADANCSIVVSSNGEPITPGTDAITYGQIITITATANEGYSISTLQVNGADYVSGTSMEVSADVTIVATSV